MRLRNLLLLFLFLVTLGMPVWADPPVQPRVLLIGDSISIGYTPFVKAALDGIAVVEHNAGNAQFTGTGLEKLDAWLGKGKWDVIHFNWGLWDLCHRNPAAADKTRRDKVNGQREVPLEQYEKNLRTLVDRLQKTGAVLVFATTTPVPEGEPGRIPSDVKAYNDAARRIMQEKGVSVNDLNALMSPVAAKYQIKPGDVHYTREGYQFLSNAVVQAVRAMLPAKRPAVPAK